MPRLAWNKLMNFVLIRVDSWLLLKFEYLIFKYSNKGK
jgi:hypothetical protein